MRVASVYRKILKKIRQYIGKRPHNKEQKENKVKQRMRMRTNEELELRACGLKELRDILNMLRIPYCLSGGALLGIIREGDFIRWDWDVEIDTKTECIRPKQNILIAKLKNAGFRIAKHYSSRINFKICAEKYGTHYEIIGYFKIGKKRYRKNSYYPVDFVRGKSEIMLRGERYSTFQVPENYLEWMYGDWKTSCRSTDISEYATLSSRTRPIIRGLFTLLSIKDRFQIL